MLEIKRTKSGRNVRSFITKHPSRRTVAKFFLKFYECSVVKTFRLDHSRRLYVFRSYSHPTLFIHFLFLSFSFFFIFHLRRFTARSNFYLLFINLLRHDWILRGAVSLYGGVQRILQVNGTALQCVTNNAVLYASTLQWSFWWLNYNSSQRYDIHIL